MSQTSQSPATPFQFQLMPELLDWEFDALKESIRQYGVLVPIVRDEVGLLIDGHHRSRACEELGIKNVPTITLAGHHGRAKAGSRSRTEYGSAEDHPKANASNCRHRTSTPTRPVKPMAG